jgi:hypothetical protein
MRIEMNNLAGLEYPSFPVLDAQAGDTQELSGVVGNQYQVMSAGGCRN